ncbi:MAG: XdhC family protein [Marinobacter sp.]|uniref:XdhC family protein n=1 Tax=Marinobacter sp. TaxID=50741 RepID=UPI00299F4FCC|nr:XdhC family protein [Marinobacter sp.]MDX1755515.1 XdhC family protein [Marinobacter sp.]
MTTSPTALSNPLAGAVPSSDQAGFVEDIRPWLYHWHRQDIPTALVTLVNYEGSSPRPIGSQMVVNAHGDHVGLISGGCLEAALVDEALACLQSDEHRLVRYGKDSDFFDIQLPCGSGIDVLITPHPEESWVRALYRSYIERTVTQWSAQLPTRSYTVHGIPSESRISGTTQKSRQLSRPDVSTSLLGFSKTYQPRPRIVAMGGGAIFDCFVDMARLFDLDLIAVSPTYTCHQEPVASGACRLTRVPLRSPGNVDPHWLDRWSAFLSLSHDHDWETTILQRVLETDAFHIAALGSRRTQARRLELLRAEGVADVQLARIKGPAGLDLGGHSPPEIALAILAEVVSTGNGKRSA